MKLIMEQWRKFNEEEGEDEERSELDKISEIFANNGAQAVELGEMLLPDAKEIGMMKRAVRVVREFLELFEKPAADREQRLRARGTFYYDMNQTLKVAIPQTLGGAIGQRAFYKRKKEGAGTVMTMYQNLGRIYGDLDAFIAPKRAGAKKSDAHLPDIEAAAEWAGVPMPKVAEEFAA